MSNYRRARIKANWLLVAITLLSALLAGLIVSKGGDSMASGYPDWTEPVLLMGQDPDGNLILVQVDADGQLTVPFKGLNPSAELVTIAVDADGQLFAVLRGANDVDVAVDASGFLSAILKGEKADTSLANIAIDDDGQLYTIIKGSSGNIVAVDSDGFITAVLKGDYEGSLTTIGLDDEGRITGYLVDDEDQWSEVVKVGNAELAARLGAPVSWDRRGQVLDLYTFKNGLGGVRTDTSGAGTDVAISPVYCLYDGYSALLDAGNTDGNTAKIAMRRAQNPSSRYGGQFSFATGSNYGFVQIFLKVYDGSTLSQGSVRIDVDADTFQLRNSAGTWIQLASGVNLALEPHTWHRMKLVIDVSTGYYVRALLNNTEYDLTGYALNTPSSSTAPQLQMEAIAECEHVLGTEVYIDGLVLTAEEP